MYHHSQVLRAAFESSFIEGLTQTYTIKDTSVEAFRLFVQWLYGQKLDIGQLKSEEEKEMLRAKDKDWSDKEDLCLAELWVLGDKFIIPRLQTTSSILLSPSPKTTMMNS